MSNRPRIIIASPDLLECDAVADWLSAEGFEPVRRSNVRAAVNEIQARPFDLLIADAALAFRDGLHIASRVRRPQTPTVVIGDVDHQNESLSRQMICLARPVERTLMVCTVCLVIADGRPQRCSPRKPVHRFEALVNGVPSHIIDVSNEGLRLEVPRDLRSVPPPYFSVRVPMVGVAVTVQRVWARNSGEGTAVMCGAALSQNQATAAQGWLAFVDNLPKTGAPSLDSLQIH
jgi:CheY-like chemotaxis protein